MDNVLTPPPGRDTDELIAASVMNWSVDPLSKKWRVNSNVERAELPPFSTSSTAIQEVIDAMESRGYSQIARTRQHSGTWIAGFSNVEKGPIRGDGQTEEHAVCIAALRSLGIL